MKKRLAWFVVFAALLMCALCAAENENQFRWAAFWDEGQIVLCDEREDLERLKKTVSLGVGETRTIFAPPEEEAVFVSSNSKVLTVDENGLVTAVKRGSAVVKVTIAGTEAASVKFEVLKAPTRVQLNKTSLKIKLGAQQTLTAKLSSNSASALTWTSTDERVAMVDENGLVTPQGEGECKITVSTFNGLSASCTVKASMPAPAKVKLGAYKASVYEGETYYLKISLDGGYRETFTCVSDDESVLIAGDDGSCYAVRPGTAIVRVEASGGNYTNCVVTVLPGSTGIEFPAETRILYETGSMTVNARTEGGSGKYALSSLTPELAKADEETGEIRALRAGTAVIRATTPNGLWADCEIMVLPLPERFELALDSPTVAVSEEARAYLPGAALPVAFASSNPKVATVGEDGTVKGLKAGKTVLTAKTGGLERELEIEIQKIAKSIQLSCDRLTLCEGDSEKLTYTLSGGAGRPKFTSSDERVLSVDAQTGVVTALSKGEAKITVTLPGGVKAVCRVTVQNAPEWIRIAEAEVVIGAGDGYLASYELNDGIRANVFWESLDDSVITADENGFLRSTGVCGTALVRARTANGCEDTALVTVISEPESFSVNATPLLFSDAFDAYVCVKKGESAVLTANCPGYTFVTFEYASTQPQVASVSENGIVKACSVGTTLVTVRSYAGKETRVLVEVTDP